MTKTTIYFLLTVISLTACHNNTQTKVMNKQKEKSMKTADFTTTLLVDQNPGIV